MPKLIDHHHKRESILGNVSKLILKGSIGTLGLREIAKSAKVSVGSLTHYFGAKEGLYDSLVTRAGTLMNWHLRQAIAGEGKKKDKLRKIFDYVLENEDEVLIQILIILDAARARPSRDREKRSKRTRSERIYFDVLVGECDLTEAEARYFTTHIIGMLVRRMWTGRSESELPQFDMISVALT